MPSKKPKIETRGRPEHQVTAQTKGVVEALAGVGISHENIARVLQIAVHTLYKYYRPELDEGAAKVEAKLVSNLLQIANGRDATALKAIMFALTFRFGWTSYDPPPRSEFPVLGKKAQLEHDAQTAHEKSSWGDLLN